MTEYDRYDMEREENEDQCDGGNDDDGLETPGHCFDHCSPWSIQLPKSPDQNDVDHDHDADLDLGVGGHFRI